jgi:hypothetical protein
MIMSGDSPDIKEIVTTYKMVNDTLKIVNVEEIPFYIVYFQS